MDSSPTDKIINACPSCGDLVDVSVCAPFSKVICPSCGQAIRVRADFHHFSIQRQIGEGGMSRVFEAEDVTLGRKVALKILNPQFSQDAKRVEGFEKEARMTASIQHPNVVNVYSVDSDQGQLFIAMELVPGGNLDDLIHKEKQLPEAKVLEIGVRIAEGLQSAYEVGLIHRDIKPGNILFSENGEPKLVDFGLALMFERDVDEDEEIWATPFYVPPEKLHKKPEDFRSDIYSLGATLFHASAGRPPYNAKSSSLEELKAIKDKPVSVVDAAPNLSNGVVELIDRMMARDPANRHESYQALLENFRYLQEENTLGASGPKVQRVRVLAGITAAVVLLGIVVGMATWGGGKDKSENNAASVPVAEEGAIKSVEGKKTLAQRFVDARKAMVEGEIKKAADGFRKIATDEDMKQPTLNWSRFNLGLGQLLQGNVEGANRWFALLIADTEADEESREAVEFLKQLGIRMNDPLPVLAEERSEFDSSVFRGVAWLSFALKNWQHGEFDEASQYFEAFAKERPALPERWIADYRPLLKPYTEDYALMRDLPPPSRTMVLKEAEGWLKTVEGADEKLKTPGAAPAYLGKRKARLEALVAQLIRDEEEREGVKLAELFVREKEKLEEVREQLSGFQGSAQIQDAIELIDGVNFEHPEVRAEFDKVTYVWRESDQFLRQVLEDLDEHGYEGTLERLSGGDADVVIVAASEEYGVKFRFRDLAVSESVIPLEDIAPETLLEIAEEMSMKDPEMEEYLKRRKYLALFAYHVGEVETALDAVEELKSYDKRFVENWREVIQLDSAGSSNRG
ncbi:MAG: serine/threonine-protein kinase [Verrucomicrobiota bacterium]